MDLDFFCVESQDIVFADMCDCNYGQSGYTTFVIFDLVSNDKEESVFFGTYSCSSFGRNW